MSSKYQDDNINIQSTILLKAWHNIQRKFIKQQLKFNLETKY